MRKTLGIYFIILAIVTCSGCSFGRKIKDGATAYERKQYAVATGMLSEEYEEADNERSRGEIAYLLGDSYRYLEENSLSIDWLEKAVKFNYGNEALLALAKAYKKEGQYAEAIETYERLKDKVSNKRKVEREIYVIKEVSEWAGTPVEGVSVKMINENSAFSEYSPTVLDKNFLVFTADIEAGTGTETYQWTGNKHSDIFVMLKNGSDIKRFDAEINTDANEGAACFTSDGLEMVFTRCEVRGDDDGYCQLMYSERFSGIWSSPRVIPGLQTGVNYGHPTFIEGDSVLVFSAKIEEGAGGYDLYYVERVFDEVGGFDWGEAFIFPPTVNSVGNEMFPVGDGDTLYFSSDHFAGLGGLDIFKTYLQANGQWAPPQNLKAPINSSSDDFGYFVDRYAQLRGSELEKGFFTSTRSGYGKEDIYRYQRSRTQISVDTTTTINDDEPEIAIDIYLAGKTKEIAYAIEGDPNSGAVGKLVLAKSYVTIDDGSTTENIYSDEEGNFFFTLQKDKQYRIKGSKIGYLNDFVTIDTKNIAVEKGKLSVTLNTELILNKIFSNVEITLENIYYNFNKSDIRNDAKPTLDSLSQLLLENPQINIQLSSHTDCRGDSEYNQILSQKRAESAVRYIQQKGVAISRMTAKGYGKNALSINCNCDDCTEEEHQINRRTTFKILE